MKYSVIIPCLNEEGTVPRLIDALKLQTFKDFEVIVADSASTDGTVAVVKRNGFDLSLKVVKMGERGVAKARNGAAAEAKGEWLVFLDADVVVPPEFLQRLDQGMTKHRVGVGSVNFFPNSKHPVDRFGAFLALLWAIAFSWTKHPVASGFCIAIKRDIHDEIGGFDPGLKLGEDHDYVTRAVAAGARFAHLTDTHVLISLRRFESEGKVRMFFTYFFIEIYRLANGFKIKKDIIKYEFGNHDQS